MTLNQNVEKRMGGTENRPHVPRVVCPATVAEGIEAVARIAEEVVFIGGGTDLVIKLQAGQIRPAWLVDLSLISELKFIKEVEGRIRIGSGTTFGEISESDLLWKQARCLGQAASQVGSVQIRNRGTLGGNIANASPAGDSLPALLVLEAWVTIAGPQGCRRVPFAQFQEGNGQGLREKEIITEIDFPIRKSLLNFLQDSHPDSQPKATISSAFGKIGSRSAVSIARLNMAAMVEYDTEERRILDSRWAVGTLGPRPFRLEELERELQGKQVSSDLAEEVADHLTSVVDRAIPGRPSQEYKRQAIRGLAYDLLEDLLPKS